MTVCSALDLEPFVDDDVTVVYTGYHVNVTGHGRNRYMRFGRCADFDRLFPVVQRLLLLAAHEVLRHLARPVPVASEVVNPRTEYRQNDVDELRLADLEDELRPVVGQTPGVKVA